MEAWGGRPDVRRGRQGYAPDAWRPAGTEAPLAVVTFVPDLHQLSNGRFEATCCKCLKLSPSITAPDKTTAWGEMLKLGWSVYQHAPGTRQYALCPSCTAHPRTVDDAVKRAHEARKRK